MIGPSHWPMAMEDVMKNVLCSLLMAAMVASAVPVVAAERATDATRTPAPIAGALKDAGLTVSPQRPASNAVAATRVPLSLPRSGSGHARKSVTMMVTTLVTTAAGAAASIYMLKELQKEQERQQEGK